MGFGLNFINTSKNDLKIDVEPLQAPEIILPKIPVKQRCSEWFTWKVVALTMGFCLFGMMVLNTVLLVWHLYYLTPVATIVFPISPDSTLAEVSSYVSDDGDRDLGNDINIFKRDRWGGREIRDGYQNRTLVHPINLVIIGHTASNQCMTFRKCASYMQSVQSDHVSEFNYIDIKYNFLIGGDGNIYEALGWDIQNYIRKNSIHISFVGNYIYDQVLDRQRIAVQALLKRGIELGKLDKDYLLVAHSQVANTLSPGKNLLSEIKLWSHYYNGNFS